jgi:Putative beta-barrel porin-2, OmpL-like. bbp2
MKLRLLCLLILTQSLVPAPAQAADSKSAESLRNPRCLASGVAGGKFGQCGIAKVSCAPFMVAAIAPDVLLALHEADVPASDQELLRAEIPKIAVPPASDNKIASNDISLTKVPASLSTDNATEPLQIADNTQPVPEGSPQVNVPAPKGQNVIPKPAPTSQFPFAPEGDTRRALPAPLDPVFPSTEYVGVAGQTQIGIPNLNPVFPLEKAIYQACPILKKQRIEIYGWVNPGGDRSTSLHSNVPQSYSIVPNKLELDQLVFRIDRMPDTVQQQHNDWGMRISMVYGIDTRYTVAAGWYPASGQVLGQNRLYSWDPVELYGLYYIPKIKEHKLLDGLVIKVGRYISPPDIEAQLAPDNYLWTHSLMFTYDNYTQTGILASLKLNKQWMVQAGIHSGDDIAPWSPAAIPSAEAFLRWQSKTNNDSIYGGMNSINNGRYRLAARDDGNHGHDNLQQFNVTWGHRFSRRVHMMTEAYYIYQIDALKGGTVVSGPGKPYFENVGPGVLLPGVSSAWGVVNYTNIKITDKDYITFRPVDFLGDPRGQRTGFATTYASWTVGWCHRFSDLLCIRPEIRYERALTDINPYDNGKRRYEFTFGTDLIQRF